ncbi:hypothetical protein ETD86_00365 [Nonomuraea turkmeniaca]|uniref:PLAT domain-containing protein n=1 Tax=Nonomuraea turkmeniaca TaxID=103838 RepID=A0A5S4FY46_9ACTN|nr:hypothetical protein [Nonomuraea turkmeniaca]TMR25618.1 hypothetical protein ETD86_00365 [Nonomuraea turkmeniaca]
MTSILKTTAIFGTMGVALSITPAAGASASNSTASSAAARALYGQCHVGDRDRFAYLTVYYTPKNGYDEIDEIKYNLGANSGNQLGNKSNVRLRIRRDLPYSLDRTLWSWTSGDDIKPGSHSKDPNTRVKYSTKWHVDLKATFDIKGIDPQCSTHTRSV